ncbi:MAG: FkbM family methyltransferase [Parcubacteria group bacterium]|nr:FkbM family methyltransferase [Parcubacteria group bacterium]
MFFPEEGYNSAEGTISLNGKRKIKSRSLDEMSLKGEILPPDYIKIDVEGSELLVLSGSKELLSKYYPTIFLSIHGIDNHEKCCKFLRSIGYELQSADSKVDISQTHEIVAFRL